MAEEIFQIFRMGLMTELDQCVKVIGDRIYGAEAPHGVRAPGIIFAKPEKRAMEKAV